MRVHGCRAPSAGGTDELHEKELTLGPADTILYYEFWGAVGWRTGTGKTSGMRCRLHHGKKMPMSKVRVAVELHGVSVRQADLPNVW